MQICPRIRKFWALCGRTISFAYVTNLDCLPKAQLSISGIISRTTWTFTVTHSIGILGTLHYSQSTENPADPSNNRNTNYSHPHLLLPQVYHTALLLDRHPIHTIPGMALTDTPRIKTTTTFPTILFYNHLNLITESIILLSSKSSNNLMTPILSRLSRMPITSHPLQTGQPIHSEVLFLPQFYRLTVVSIFYSILRWISSFVFILFLDTMKSLFIIVALCSPIATLWSRSDTMKSYSDTMQSLSQTLCSPLRRDAVSPISISGRDSVP